MDLHVGAEHHSEWAAPHPEGAATELSKGAESIFFLAIVGVILLSVVTLWKVGERERHKEH